MSKITLYLHIGATKTGTTALQRFLEQNFSRLQELGVFYPNFHDKNVYTPMRPGHNYWQGHHFENFDGSYDLDIFNRCIQYCKENSLRSIVISHEALLVNWPDRVGLLSNKLDVEIKIICYVRRQDHHLESAWKQVGHKFCSSNELLDSLNTKTEWGGWRNTNWYLRIAPWAKYFGKENIIIRPYEKQQMPDGIFTDFLNVIAVSWPEEPTLSTGVNVNAGFSRDILEFLYLNKDFYTDLGDQRLHNMLYHLLDDDYKKKPFEAYGILSPKDRIELLNRYEPSNQLVAKEYLNREDGRLFYEPWPNIDDSWEPYEGLTVEKLTPILTNLIFKLYTQQNVLNAKLQQNSSTFLERVKRRASGLFHKLRTSSFLFPIKAWYHQIKR